MWMFSTRKKSKSYKKATESRIKDLKNKKCGTWTALYRLNKQNKSGNYYWLCQCENGHYQEIDTGNWGKIKKCRQYKNGCSIGELVIQESLLKLNIAFIEEYTFKDCIYKKPLRFDFYLPEYNCCIEYDGIQHFKKTNFSHDNYEDRKIRDEIKNQYCIKNNINLIRIPYTDLDLINEVYVLNKLKEIIV